MNTVSRGQDNRYLESPHVIKNTGSEEQMPFKIKNHLEGGVLFSKKSFSTKSLGPNHPGRDNAAREDGLIESEGFRGQYPN